MLVVAVYLRLSRIGCSCNTTGVHILSSIGTSFRSKGVCTVANPSKTKGDALLSLLTNLSTPSSKIIHFRNRSVTAANCSGRHHRRISLIFRSRGLVSCLAPRRGLHLIGPGTSVGVLRSLKLDHRRSGHGVVRLSNNRHRQITINHTLITPNHTVLTSRPANDLSPRVASRIVSLLQRTTRRLNGYIVIIARSGHITSSTSTICALERGGLTGT